MRSGARGLAWRSDGMAIALTRGMYAALFVIAQLVSNTSPAPSQVVLDGCGNASAARVAELARTPAESPRVHGLLELLLTREDGATCLMESRVLVTLHRSGRAHDLVERALLTGLRAKARHVSTRAAELASEIRVFDPAAYDGLMRRAGARGGAWGAFSHGPDPREPERVTVAI